MEVNHSYASNRVRDTHLDFGESLGLDDSVAKIVKLIAESGGDHIGNAAEIVASTYWKGKEGELEKSQRTRASDEDEKQSLLAIIAAAESEQRYERPEIAQGRRKMGFPGIAKLAALVGVAAAIFGLENYGTALLVQSVGFWPDFTQTRLGLLLPGILGITASWIVPFLPYRTERRIRLGAFGVVGIGLLAWATGFAIEMAKFAHAAQASLMDAASGALLAPTQGWSANMMFGAMVVLLAVSVFCLEGAIEALYHSYDIRVKNPAWQRAQDAIEAAQHALKAINKSIAATEQQIAALHAGERQMVAKGRAAYLIWKAACAVMLAASLLLPGCSSEPAPPSPQGRTVASDKGVTAHNQFQGLTIGLSPAFSTATKAELRPMLAQLLESLAAEPGKTVTVINDWDGALIARTTVKDASLPLRRQAIAPVMVAVWAFLDREDPSGVADGRVHLPRFAQTVAQLNPTPQQVVVLGSMLFRAAPGSPDQAFSMVGGSGKCPTDGMLFADHRYSIYSVVGREEALRGTYWSFGWTSDQDIQFFDDSHFQRVREFWANFIHLQGGCLTTAQNSLAGAFDAARAGKTAPLLDVRPDRNVAPAMVTIHKVMREVSKAHDIDAIEEVQNHDSVEQTMDPARDASNATEAPPQPAKREVHKEVSELMPPPATEIEPQKAVDAFGNLRGGEYDLIKSGQMRGHRILVVKFYTDADVESSPLPAALESKGFEVTQIPGYPLLDLEEFKSRLQNVDELWIYSSGDASQLTVDYVSAITHAFRYGNLNLCFLCENDPLSAEARVILADLAPGSKIGGNYRGEQFLRPRRSEGPGIVKDAAINHSIETLWEGTTIASVNGPLLEPVVYASNGEPLICVYQEKDSNKRMVIMGNWTSTYARYWQEAGVSRLTANIAGFLAGVSPATEGAEATR